MTNPFPAVRGFMFGIYLDLMGTEFDSPSASWRIDLDFRMADFVGLCKLPVAREYGEL